MVDAAPTYGLLNQKVIDDMHIICKKLSGKVDFSPRNPHLDADLGIALFVM
jgi:hypothetical protein